MIIWEKETQTVFLGGILISFIFIRSSVGDDVEKECIIANKDCINNEHIHFYLYSNGDDNKNNKPINLSGNIDESTFSRLDKTNTYKSMKIMVHGELGHNLDEFNLFIRRGYYAFGDKQLILSVDYEKLLDNLSCLDTGLLNIPIIARCAVQVVEDTFKFIPNIAYLHGIGFAFGTLILGKMAELMKEKANDKLKFDKITALEPFLSRMEHHWNLLDANSAIHLEAVHTNGGISGQFLPIGNIDFYINGGVNQPGCETHKHPICHKCSHIKAYEYFAESIIYQKDDCGFFATFESSSDIIDMSFLGPSEPNHNINVRFGEYSPNDVRGVYHVTTNSKQPFALKQCTNPTIQSRHQTKITETFAPVDMPPLEDAK